MRKIAPGYNDPDWTGQVQCGNNKSEYFETRTGGRGCGALLEVTKDDMYTVFSLLSSLRHGKEVRFTCPCGTENLMSSGMLFTELPSKEEWLKTHKPA